MSRTTFVNLLKLLQRRTPVFQVHQFIPKVNVRKSVKFFMVATSGIALHQCFHRKILTVRAKEKDAKSSIIQEADKLYDMNVNLQELYSYLKSHESSNDADILWRLARSARDLALKSASIPSDEKKRLMYEAFECSKKALEVDEANFACHKWYAIIIGDVGDYEGVKVKIANSYVIRDHLQRAHELNPSDATTLHCLGRWCFAFADMPRWQHAIAGIIFGTPPTATYKEAVDYFLQAEKIDPDFYSVNLLMLGKCFMKMSDVKRAMLYLDRASKYPIKNMEDEQSKQEADALLKELLERK